MATNTAPAVAAIPSPFPAKTKSTSRPVNNIVTDVTAVSFTDKLLVTISQAGRLAHWVHVPLATASADPMNPGSRVGTGIADENGLLPMSHLTATTILGGARGNDEVVGQTLATTIASAILMQRPGEERLLVVGLGLEDLTRDLTGRAQFEEIIGLVLDVL